MTLTSLTSAAVLARFPGPSTGAQLVLVASPVVTSSGPGARVTGFAPSPSSAVVLWRGVSSLWPSRRWAQSGSPRSASPVRWLCLSLPPGSLWGACPVRLLSERPRLRGLGDDRGFSTTALSPLRGSTRALHMHRRAYAHKGFAHTQTTHTCGCTHKDFVHTHAHAHTRTLYMYMHTQGLCTHRGLCVCARAHTHTHVGAFASCQELLRRPRPSGRAVGGGGAEEAHS